jgi:hypothetical protein
VRPRLAAFRSLGCLLRAAELAWIRTVRPHPSAARDFDLRWTGTCGTCCWVMRGKESEQDLDRHVGDLPVDPACREASTL